MAEELNLLLGRGPPKGARKLTRKGTSEGAPDLGRDLPPTNRRGKSVKNIRRLSDIWY